MLFKSGILTQVSGSIGGLTAARNRGGMYLRARAIPTDPNTLPQQTIRAIFASLVNRWNDVLTPAQRARWDTYAANVPLTGPLGDPITVSGQNHFIRSNTPRVQIGEAVIDSGPVIFNTGVVSALSIGNATAAGQTVDVTYNSLDPWSLAAGNFLIVQAARPVNPTINFFRGPYRVSASLQGDAIPPPNPFVASWTFAFSAGQRIFARARVSLSDGRLSEAQFVGPTLAVA